MKKIVAFASLAALILTCGCSSEIPTFPVEGTVSFKGQPLPKGEIYFDPDASLKGPQGRAIINDGKFSTKDQKSGVVAGKYQVRVHGFDGKPRQEAPYGLAIFPAYETTMELQTGKSLTIEVPGK